MKGVMNDVTHLTKLSRKSIRSVIESQVDTASLGGMRSTIGWTLSQYNHGPY